MVAFMHKCHAVTEQIMSCFAVGLGLEQDFFKEVMSHSCNCQIVPMQIDLTVCMK